MARLSLVVVLSAVVFVTHFAPISAQDKKEPTPKQKPVPTLKVGDLAPPLKVTKWLQGPEVAKFEPGKVYVVEFWATWCGPCIAFMPHLAELQAEYKDKNVTVIGFTAHELLGKPNNSENEVAAFIARSGKKFGYTFAYAADDTTGEAWLTAAGREGIPCTFVVDKDGRIAYIGHPLYLPAVLPKVVQKGATAKGVGAEMAKIEAEFNNVSALLSRDPKAGLQSLKAFEAKHPLLLDFIPSARAKLSFLPKHGETDEAKTYAEAFIAKAIKTKNVQALSMASSILRRGDGKASQELLALAVKASAAEVQIDGGNDAGSLMNLADSYFISGDKARAKEYARKAVAAASGESASFKESIEKEAVRLGAD